MKGNTHMMMMDRNSDDVAKLVDFGLGLAPLVTLGPRPNMSFQVIPLAVPP